MNFTRLPKTRKQWELIFVRGCISAGFLVLLAQIWVRVFLAGHCQQVVEEILIPCLIVTWLLLIFCTVGAFYRKERRLGDIAALVGILSALIVILTNLFREGVYD
jgi:hypothetical protein